MSIDVEKNQIPMEHLDVIIKVEKSECLDAIIKEEKSECMDVIVKEEKSEEKHNDLTTSLPEEPMVYEYKKKKRKKHKEKLDLKSECLEVLFEEVKSEEKHNDLTTSLPEEPMVYEYKKKKRKKHKEKLDLKSECLEVLFEEEKSEEKHRDPTTFLPEEPMVYEYKKKKKKKRKETKDPLKDKPLTDVVVKFDPDITIKVENIECEVDFQEITNGDGLMLDDGSQENKAEDLGIFDYGPIGYRPLDTAPTFLCDVCHLVFNTARTLRIHKKRKHNSFRKAFKFICDDCGMSYEMKNSLLAHIKRKHGPNSVPEDKVERICEICSLMFVGMNRLRMHMKRKHDAYFENFKHTCPICNLSYDKNRSLVVHMQRKHNKPQKTTHESLYNCPFCPRLFSVRDTYMKHVKRKHQMPEEYANNCPEKFLQTFAIKDNGTGELACSQCSLVFADVSRLKIHMRRKHDAYQEFFGYKCTICNLSYDKMASLKRHIRRKHDRGSYCELCQKQFDTRELYLNHSHDEEKVLECEMCSMIFSNIRSYSKHMRCTHDVDSELKSFFCSLCNDGFREKRQLRLHLSQKHFKVCYTCVHCDKIFKAKESFRRHVLNKHPVKQTKNEKMCSYCLESFSNEQDLSRHIDVAHTKSNTNQQPTTPVSDGPMDLRMLDSSPEIRKVYQCPKCPEQFIEWSDLKQHNQVIHSPPEIKVECQCQMCGLVVLEVDLPKHMRKAHTDVELNCPHCDYETTHKANLTKHLLRHTNMTPLKCDIGGCKFKTFYNSALQNHKNKHIDGKERIKLQCSKCPFQSVNKYTMKYHEEQHVTGKKKYMCDQCDYATILPANLNQHKYKHSPEKSFKCEVCPFATKYNASLRYHIKKKHCDLPVNSENE